MHTSLSPERQSHQEASGPSGSSTTSTQRDTPIRGRHHPKMQISLVCCVCLSAPHPTCSIDEHSASDTQRFLSDQSMSQTRGIPCNLRTSSILSLPIRQSSLSQSVGRGERRIVEMKRDAAGKNSIVNAAEISLSLEPNEYAYQLLLTSQTNVTHREVSPAAAE